MNDHHDIRPWGGITYWKDGGATASGKSDATNTAITVGFGLRKTTFYFAATDSHEMSRLIGAIELAVEIGDRGARKDIRRALGVVEPR